MSPEDEAATPVAPIPVETTSRAASSSFFRDELERHIAVDDQRWSVTQQVFKTLESSLIEHKVRLENGTHVFTDIKTEIAAMRGELKEVAKATSPKPINWLTIVFPVLGVLVTLLGAWWALSEKLSARPTAQEIRQMITEHGSSGHPQVSGELRALREEQLVQKGELKFLRESVDDTRRDVKELIEALRPKTKLTSPPSTP